MGIIIMMNRSGFYIVFFLVMVLGLFTVSDVRESHGEEAEKAGASAAGNSNPVFSVRDKILSYFHPASGVITSIDKDIAGVKFTSGKGFKKGMRLSVFRLGKPFLHPVTKELIGRTEEYIGLVEIRETADRSTYKCRVIEGKPDKDDLVRITSSRIKLAFFQDKKADWTLSEVFYNSLKETDRFDLLEAHTESYEPQDLSRLARDMGAAAVLFFSTPSKDGNSYLNVKLYWAGDAAIFAEADERIGADLVSELMSTDELIVTGPAEGEPWSSHLLVSGELIAMGDVDGNGEREMVVSDGRNIKIYSFKDEPREVWFIEGFSGERHIYIDVLDMNGNGRAEIFVSSLKNRKNMSSFVLEYDPSSGYKRISEKLPYAFRAVGRKLLMQGFTSARTFKGPVYEGVWRQGHYEKGDPIKLPEGVGIYGFTYVDWINNGRLYVLAFDDEGYLSLYDGDESIWKSKKRYGRFALSFDKKSYSVLEKTKKWSVKSRLVTVNTGRGQEVIVIKKTPIVARIPGLGYKDAKVYSIWWDGEMMEETLILEGVRGTVTDYLIDGKDLFLIARMNFSSFLSRALSGDFIRGSLLYYYNLETK